MQNWVTEEEERRRTHTPAVCMNIPLGFSEASVSASLKKITGIEPTKVSKVGESKFEVVVSDISEIGKLMDLNGKYFDRSDKVIRVEEKEIALGCEEIFTFINRKMALREKQDMRQGLRGRSSDENKK